MYSKRYRNIYFYIVMSLFLVTTLIVINITNNYITILPMFTIAYFIWIAINFDKILKPQYFIMAKYIYIYFLGYYNLYILRGITDYKLLAYIIVNIGAFVIGIKFYEAITLKNNIIINNSQYYLDIKKAKKFSNICLLIGTLGIFIFYIKVRGIPIFMNDLEQQRLSMLSGNGVPYYLSMLLVFSLWMSILIYKKSKVNNLIAMWSFVGFFLISTGWRNTFVTVSFIALMLLLVLDIINGRKFIILTGAILIVVIVLGLYRIAQAEIDSYYVYQLIKNKQYIEAIFFYFSSYSGTYYDAFRSVYNFYSISGTTMYGITFIWNFGMIFLGLPAFDLILKNILQLDFLGGGLPPTIIGDFYINFGLYGAFIASFAFGIFCSFIYSKLILSKNQKNYYRVLVYTIVYYFCFVAVRGGIENVTLQLTWFIIILILGQKFIKFCKKDLKKNNE